MAAVALALTNTALIANVHRRGGKSIFHKTTATAHVVKLNFGSLLLQLAGNP